MAAQRGTIASLTKSPREFPRLGETGGDMDCPYRTAPFESLKEALIAGGPLYAFIYAERAAANLVAAAWRDGAWRSVLVVCSGQLTRSRFVNNLLTVLKKMQLSDTLLKANDREVVLTNERAVNVTVRQNMLRGCHYEQIVYICTDSVPEYECHESIIAYHFDQEADETHWERQLIHPRAGFLNATLRMHVYDPRVMCITEEFAQGRPGWERRTYGRDAPVVLQGAGRGVVCTGEATYCVMNDPPVVIEKEQRGVAPPMLTCYFKEPETDDEIEQLALAIYAAMRPFGITDNTDLVSEVRRGVLDVRLMPVVGQVSGVPDTVAALALEDGPVENPQ
jgi:hypothetical protein